MRFGRLDHIGFAVSDLDRSVAWYTTFFGVPPSLRRTWSAEYLSRVVGYPGAELEAAFWMLPGGTLLELLQYHEPAPATVDMETYNAGNAHLCLVTDDVAADIERLRGTTEFRDPAPVEIDWGPYAGGRSCYLRDPDGISIQLLELPAGGNRIAA